MFTHYDCPHIVNLCEKAGSNVTEVLKVRDKSLEVRLYQAAKQLFQSILNWAGLATTLIYLGGNQAAVKSA